MKRGQNLSIGSLILIVLGVIVLVLLVLGMSMGWGTLWEKINIFGGSNSLSDVVSACKLAVTTDSKYDFCEKMFKVKVDGQKEWVGCRDPRVLRGLENPQIVCEKGYGDVIGSFCDGKNIEDQGYKFDGGRCVYKGK